MEYIISAQTNFYASYTTGLGYILLSAITRAAEPVRLIWFWEDHLYMDVQNTFQLTKIKYMVKNRAVIRTLEYFESLKVE